MVKIEKPDNRIFVVGANLKAMLEEPSREHLLQEIQNLRQEVDTLRREKADLEIMLETATQHGDLIEELLHNQCIRDPLTGLFNRRFVSDFLARKLNRSLRQQQSLGIVMFDIDRFKHFNDTFGHDAGDVVLAEVGRFLQQNIYNSDIACRYGGEEFMIILPETNLEAAKQRAEQLRDRIKYLKLEYLHQPLGAITISLGVSCFPEHGTTSAELIQVADMALYRAKALGRDRVVTAKTLNDLPQLIPSLSVELEKNTRFGC